MKTQVVLTVAESKRLIARGVLALDMVQKALKQGLVVVTSGSTNGYIAEELMEEDFDKTGYMTGKTLPAGVKEKDLKIGESVDDLVFRDGKLDPELDRLTGAENMRAGDVYIKGANALNYEEKVAGILIGHPAAGTIGGALGHVVGKRANLVIPVGLEKCVAHDIYELEREMNADCEYRGAVPRMMPVRGTIVTEIEALEALCDLNVRHMSSGGLAGAEGGIRLLVEGEKEAIECMESIIDDIHGEPPFYGEL